MAVRCLRTAGHGNRQSQVWHGGAKLCGSAQCPEASRQADGLLTNPMCGILEHSHGTTVLSPRVMRGVWGRWVGGGRGNAPHHPDTIGARRCGWLGMTLRGKDGNWGSLKRGTRYWKLALRIGYLSRRILSIIDFFRLGGVVARGMRDSMPIVEARVSTKAWQGPQLLRWL